jgi:hypothetical protein
MASREGTFKLLYIYCLWDFTCKREITVLVDFLNKIVFRSCVQYHKAKFWMQNFLNRSTSWIKTSTLKHTWLPGKALSNSSVGGYFLLLFSTKLHIWVVTPISNCLLWVPYIYNYILYRVTPLDNWKFHLEAYSCFDQIQFYK